MVDPSGPRPIGLYFEHPLACLGYEINFVYIFMTCYHAYTDKSVDACGGSHCPSFHFV